MKTIEMMGVHSTFHQKNLLNPDRIFIFFTTISIIGRSILNFFLSENFLNRYSKIEITFIFSSILSLFFIFYCFINKVDWYGKQKKDIVPAVRKLFAQKRWTNILFFPLIFFFDPFLFFVYLKNGSKKITWQILAWLLLFLSLIINSLLWFYLGRAKDTIGLIPFFIATVMVLLYYRRLKKWAENYLKEPEA